MSDIETVLSRLSDLEGLERELRTPVFTPMTPIVHGISTYPSSPHRREPKAGEEWYVKLKGNNEVVLRNIDKITDKIIVLSYTKEKWSTGEYIRYPVTYYRGDVHLIESCFANIGRTSLEGVNYG